MGLSTSIFVQKIVDYVLVDGNKNLLNLMGVGMVVLLLFQIFIGAVKSILTLRTGQLIDAQLILGYYKHLLKLPQRFFDTMRVGEIISRINDAVKIRAFINDVTINLLVNIFIVFFLFWVNVYLLLEAGIDYIAHHSFLLDYLLHHQLCQQENTA